MFTIIGWRYTAPTHLEFDGLMSSWLFSCYCLSLQVLRLVVEVLGLFHGIVLNDLGTRLEES